jgi:hypothetical protein
MSEGESRGIVSSGIKSSIMSFSDGAKENRTTLAASLRTGATMPRLC